MKHSVLLTRFLGLRRGLVISACLFFVALVAAACSSSSAAGTHTGQPYRGAQARQAGIPSASATTATPAQTPVTVLPPVIFTAASGDTATINVEIADTESSQEIGLMNRPSMPDDQGMIFIFSRENLTPFWMKDTLIDLSIAFINGNGVIVDIQEMKAQTLDNHNPAAPYQYALEANAGWYDRHGIHVGDTADVSQAVAASPVFGQGTATPTP
jgi:uncharacterized protein